jgi:hypothetical protein
MTLIIVAVAVLLACASARFFIREIKNAPTVDECGHCGYIRCKGEQLFIMKKGSYLNHAIVVGICCKGEFESKGYQVGGTILI